MLTFDQLWDLLITQDESQKIEVKEGSDVGKSCLQTICAFANEPDLDGGYLILGIKAPENSDSKQYEITGIDDIDKIQRDISSWCNQKFNIIIRPKIQLATKDNKTLIVAYIPEAKSTEKPVYIQATGLPKGAYRRIGSGDHRCTDNDLRELFKEDQYSSYDTTPITEATLEDLDTNAINAYRQAKAKLKPNAPELNYSDQDLLYSLNVISKYKDNYCPTIAGLLLFGKAIALRRYCPLHRVDYMLIEGTEWISDSQDRYQTIEIREPLLLAIPRIVTSVLNDLPNRFGLAENEINRQEIPLIPRNVIREAIVNAVMHRDYRIRSPIQIIKYSNRLEIRNCGYSLKPLNRETLGEPGSVLRNEAIASVLHETGFAETKGSGIRVMIESMLEANLSLPEFNSNHHQDQFQVILYSHNLFDEETLQWLIQFKEYNLNNEESKILVVLKEIGTINNSICRLVNDVDINKASKQLTKLRDLGLIDQNGKSTATYYTLKPEFLSGESPFNSPNLGVRGRSTINDDSLSRQSSSKDHDSSTINDDSLSRQSSSKDHDSSTKIQKQLTLELFPPAFSKLLQDRIDKNQEEENPEETKNLILELCKIKAYTSGQLADTLGREKKHLLKNYLKPLIKDKLLEYIYPEKPNHPDQAYRTISK